MNHALSIIYPSSCVDQDPLLTLFFVRYGTMYAALAKGCQPMSATEHLLVSTCKVSITGKSGGYDEVDDLFR